MKKHSDRDYVPEYGDIVLGDMNGVISSLPSIIEAISKAESDNDVMSLDEFKVFCLRDNDSGVDLVVSTIQSMYEDYVADCKEEAQDTLSELKDELKYLDERQLVKVSIESEFGPVDFFLCKRSTEGCEFSIVPHEWLCHIRDSDGKPLLTIYGSAYFEAEEGSANSRQMFEMCDMHTHQEVHMYWGYKEYLQKKALESDGYYDCAEEMLDEMLSGAPLVFVQYMKRDRSREDMKGAGVFALRHSLACINSHFEGYSAYVVVCPEVYGYYKPKEKPAALAKLTKVISDGLLGENAVCESVDFLKFKM